MWGYEVEARAVDDAGNVMAKTVGGGLTYILGKLVAGFLSFLLGPAIGGAVFGFFLGMLAGLFEDLSIFLQIGEIAKAITQLPALIGQLFGNPGMLVALFVDMITAHMTRCMMVNPYGTPSGTPDQWANWVPSGSSGRSRAARRFPLRTGHSDPVRRIVDDQIRGFPRPLVVFDPLAQPRGRVALPAHVA